MAAGCYSVYTCISFHILHIMYSSVQSERIHAQKHNFRWENGSCALAAFMGCRLTMIKAKEKKKKQHMKARMENKQRKNVIFLVFRVIFCLLC